MQTLASRHFIEHGDNVLVLGPPGVGKSHLAVALGLKAIAPGYRVLFSTAANLIATLAKAHADGRLDKKLKFYTTPRLLIIDEIGYLPIERLGAYVLCQLSSPRYERHTGERRSQATSDSRKRGPRCGFCHGRRPPPAARRSICRFTPTLRLH